MHSHLDKSSGPEDLVEESKHCCGDKSDGKKVKLSAGWDPEVRTPKVHSMLLPWALVISQLKVMLYAIQGLLSSAAAADATNFRSRFSYQTH